MNIWRLNVKETQISECIKSMKFAIDVKPKVPEIQKGDPLLLQLVSVDAIRTDKKNSRIEFALIFDHYSYDHDGSVSKYYWPHAGKTWKWILHCSEIIPTIPFSLENLQLTKHYAGQTNPVHIAHLDISKILPYILRYDKVKNIGLKMHNIFIKEPSNSNYALWSLIQNNDRIVEDSPDRIEWNIILSRKELKRNPELPCALKELYKFKCQVCGFDFQPNYGIPYSETHHIIWISRGGADHSNNLIVVCPNHHRIIHEAKPKFNRSQLTFEYNNGLHEHLKHTDHLKDVSLMQKVETWVDLRFRKIESEKLN
jgi:5-methylcytosine-specific restriction endonuclease McrA